MLEQLKENWEKILDNVKEDQDLSDVSFNTWLVPLKPVSVEGNSCDNPVSGQFNRSGIHRQEV